MLEIKKKKTPKAIFSVIMCILLVFSSMSFTGLTKVEASSTPNLLVDYEFTDPGDGVTLPIDKKGNSTLTEVSGTVSGKYGEKTYGNTTATYDADSTGAYWQWTSNANRGGGFTLDIDPKGKDISTSYTISVRFSYDTFTSSWTKIIDYKDKMDDTGFYFTGDKKLKFYNVGNEGQTSINPKSVIDIIATRDADTKKFIAYMMVDGVFKKEIEVDDINGQAVPTTVDGKIRFGFFHDDSASKTDELTTGGKVYSIKFWDGAVEPAEVLEAVATKGTAEGSTKISIPTSAGNSFKVLVSNQLLEYPLQGDSLPQGTQSYTSDDDIGGVDAHTNKYIGIYEVDSKGNIVGFRLITLTDNVIKVVKQPLRDKQTEITNENLVKSEYTAGSWADLVAKQQAATAVLDNDDATQQEVDDALAALEAARTALVENNPNPANLGTPGGVSTGLISWVDVERSKLLDNEANTISKLTDLADNGEWVPIGGGNTEVSNALNFNGGIHIASSKGYFTRKIAEFDTDASAREVFSVQSSDNNSGFPWEFGGSEKVGKPTYGQTIYTYFGRTETRVEVPVDNYDLKNGAMLNIWSATNDWQLSLNGESLHHENINTPIFTSPAGPYYWGAGHSSRFNGMIAETILYDRKLDDAERNKVNSYLALKYGLTLQTDYIASDGSTKMWTLDDNAGYGNRITGIGRDDNGALNQKQSKSQVDDANITIALGNTIEETNKLNGNTITSDKSFFTFSDNGEEAQFVTLTNKDEENLKLLERIYKVEKTNWQDIDITFEADKIEEALKWPLYLVVSSDENFDKNDEFYELTEGKVTLNSSKFANEEYFTIAAPVPAPTKMELGQPGNQLVLTFDQELALTSPQSAGFTVTVGNQKITLKDEDFEIDPTDPTKLIIKLPEGTDITDQEIKVHYDGTGNLQGTNGVPVTDFTQTVTVAKEVDKSKLQAKIIEEATLTESDYTSTSWDNYQDELAKAQTIFDNPNATQAEVDKALADLTAAQNALVNKKLLQDQVNDAVTKNEDEYTPDSWNQFKDALTEAERVLNDPDATQQQVDDALDALKDAQDNLVPLTPPSYKDAFTITKPDTVTNNPNPTFGGKVETSTTTPSTVTIELTDEHGEVVKGAGGEATVDENGNWSFTLPTDLPDGTYTITATATNGTETVTKTHTFTVTTQQAADKTALQNKANESKNLNPGSYTPDSWLSYQDRLNNVQTVLDDPNATQAEVDAALEALTTAQNALVSVITVDKSQLQTKVNEGNGLSASNYTSTSWSNYLDKLNAAQSVLNNPNATQAEVDAALNALTAAQNALIYTGNSGSSGGGDNSWVPTPPTTESGSTTTKIKVELEIDGDNPLAKTTVEIERTTDKNGRVTDLVKLTEENAKEAVAKAKEIGNTVARIVLPDANDEVDEVTVEISKQSIQLLRENGLDLEISTKDGLVTIPTSSLTGVDDQFYFRLIPVKKDNERKAIEERARVEQVVREKMGSNDINVLARPMTIETNMPNRPVIVTLPLRGVTIPTDSAERQAFLDRLAVFIEHSDGEKKVVKPTVVTMANGELGLQFTVEKFSTFTIIQVNAQEEPTLPTIEVKSHDAYIKGFENGTFGPDKNVTRAQIATMIARILGYEDEAINFSPFKDVASTHYAAGAIAFVKDAGMMNGDKNGNFNASANITRAEMATVVANFKDFDIQDNGTTTFKDTKGHWAQAIIEANRAAGIINGREDGRFAPNDSLTRAEAVTMINRMIERGPLNGVTYSSFSDVKTTHWAFENIEEAANDHSYIVDGNGEEQLSK